MKSYASGSHLKGCIKKGRPPPSQGLKLETPGLKDLNVVLCQPIITPYVRVIQACFQRAFAKSFDDHYSSNIVAFSFHAGDYMILAA
eukprot:1156258-Pelagomonas_calceolata.AAC.3